MFSSFFESKLKAQNENAVMFLLLMLLCAISSCTGANGPIVRSFEKYISKIQVHTVKWLQNVVPGLLGQKSKDQIRFYFLKLMFMEKDDVYCKTDHWPPEVERK